MSPVAMPVASDAHFEPFIEALRTAPTALGEKLRTDLSFRELTMLLQTLKPPQTGLPLK